MAPDVLAGWVTGAVGVLLAALGVTAIEAGKGGYGYGPVPMVPVPRDNGLIAIGLVLAAVGGLLLVVAWMVVA